MRKCNPRTNWLMQPWHQRDPLSTLSTVHWGGGGQQGQQEPAGLVSQTAAQTKASQHKAPARACQANRRRRRRRKRGARGTAMTCICHTVQRLPRLGSGNMVWNPPRPIKKILDHWTAGPRHHCTTAPLGGWSAVSMLLLLQPTAALDDARASFASNRVPWRCWALALSPNHQGCVAALALHGAAWRIILSVSRTRKRHSTM